MITVKRLLKKADHMWVFLFSTPFFLVGLWMARYSPSVQIKLLIVAALFYLALALMHHQKDKTLTFEIVIEYILIAALALIVLQGMFF